MSPSLHRAVQRACWLAELAAALDHANKLALELCDHRAHIREAVVLRHHILTLRGEVDSIQKARQPDAGQTHPNWR